MAVNLEFSEIRKILKELLSRSGSSMALICRGVRDSYLGHRRRITGQETDSIPFHPLPTVQLAELLNESLCVPAG